MIPFLAGLGAFFATELAKRVTRRTILPWRKLALVLFCSFGMTALWLLPHINALHLVFYGIAGAGVAVILHRLARVVRLAGDVLIQRIYEMRGQ